MLNRASRLTTKQFNEAMKAGKVIHSPLFMARVQYGTKLLRIAAVAPVKIAKTAVLRNRTRRRVYGSVRSLWGSIEGTAHIIIFAKAPFLKTDDADAISGDLKDLFVKAKLLR